MFSRFVNSIRDTINRTNTTNTNKQIKDQKHADNTSDYSAESRRPSVTEEIMKKCDSLPSNNVVRSNSVSEPVNIRPGAPTNGRRRSSLFGISNVTYDDYVQKDLISSSWS